jgi:hypothetical protein
MIGDAFAAPALAEVQIEDSADDGDFVGVGDLRVRAVGAIGNAVTDAVVCGENREGVGLLLYPNPRLSLDKTGPSAGNTADTVTFTLTLRNANDYAVKDIEIACAFARRDGSHLTDRRKVIADTVNTRSRKTYSGMLIGFVNVNANKAKCSLVTASRT